MRKVVQIIAIMLGLFAGSNARAVVPDLFWLGIEQSGTTNWSYWTPYKHHDCGDGCEVWHVAIEQTAALNGDALNLYYNPHGTDIELIYVYENSDYDYMAYSVNVGTYNYLQTWDGYDIDWEDDQLIAYLVHDDDGDSTVIYLVVQLYTIGK